MRNAVLLLVLAAAPLAAAQPAPEEVAPTSPATVLTEPSLASPPTTTALGEFAKKFTLSGYARFGVFYTFPFRDEQFVGGNGGFRVADARLELGFQPVSWGRFFISIEGAAPHVDDTDPTSGTRVVEMRDGFADFNVRPWLNVKVGQFRPPFYAEMLEPDASLPFVGRSVIAEGYNPPDAYGPRKGIVLDRQLGLEAYSERLGNDSVGFKYGVGVFNGNGANQLFNDNNAVMPVARVEIDALSKVTLGLNVAYNPKSEGARPNRVDVTQLKSGADLTATFGGLHLIAALTMSHSTYASDLLPAEDALGVLAQAHYVHDATGLEAAVRYAYLEPSTAQADDKVQDFSAMAGYRVLKGPVRLVLQFEHREEEAAVAIANDSVILFAHATF